MSEQNSDQPTLLADVGRKMPQGQPSKGLRAIGTHVVQNKIECILVSIRFAIVCFAFIYMIPFLRSECEHIYYKILLAHGAASLVRVFQKFPWLFAGDVDLALADNSSNDLLYSILFYWLPPLSWIWLPIFIFALLHISNYYMELVEAELFAQSPFGFLKKNVEFVELQSMNFFRIIAIVEMFILLIIPFSLFSFSLSGFLLTSFTIFIYLGFITLRYRSKQNPVTRIVFGQVIEKMEILATKPSCPVCFSNVLIILTTSVRVRVDPIADEKDLIRLKKPLLGKKRFISGL